MKLSRLIILFTGVALLCLIAVLYVASIDHEQSLDLRPRTYSSYDPLEHCVTDFGTILGYAGDVPAFSNCISTFKTTYVNYVNLMDPNDVGRRGDPSETTVVMLGMRYTFIDFYSRWLAWNRGLMPRLVEDANQFWKTSTFYNPAKPEQDWEAEYISNFAEASNLEELKFNAPRKADAILYNADNDILPSGHMAVIVKVEDDVQAAGGPEQFAALKKLRVHPRRVYVAEQNFKNEDWGGKNYTRVLRFEWRRVPQSKSTYEGFFTDPDNLSVIGFVRVGKPQPLRDPGNPYEETLLMDDGEGDL